MQSIRHLSQNSRITMTLPTFLTPLPISTPHPHRIPRTSLKPPHHHRHHHHHHSTMMLTPDKTTHPTPTPPPPTSKTPGNPRVRFAPSPTGSLHVGGARTALYNYLLSKQYPDGKFIIRVEDTDRQRSTLESEQEMLFDLKWLGLNWDEGPIIDDDDDKNGGGGGECGPYRQSERGDIYREYARRLVEIGRAYYCFCSEEELEGKRVAAEREGRMVKYDGMWRGRSVEDVERMLREGKEYTVRFKVLEGEKVVVRDKVRGVVEWDANKTVGDFVLLRSSGVPVYNFCVAVDDALMGVSLVVRAEEHLTNTLRQVLILRALGFEVPEYAHCSLILGKDRAKLSKRHGATSVTQFKDEGYLPEAMLNYLATLGWNDGTEKEVFTVDELIQCFSLERLAKAPAIFDDVKLRWINKQHLKAMPVSKLADLCVTQLVKNETIDNDVEPDSLLGMTITQLVQGSIEILSDADAAFRDALTYPLEETLKGEEAKELLSQVGGFKELAGAVVEAFENGELPDGKDGEEHMAKWKKWIKALGKAHGKKGKALFHPVRLALTGKMNGPDVGLVLLLLHTAEGKTKHEVVTLEKRIEKLKSFLAGL